MAGQFISIIIDTTSKRSYSLSSSPTNKKFLSTVVDITPQGQGTRYLSSLSVGDLINFEGPFGHMVLPEDFAEKEALNFIATGTGISPFLSIIKFLNTVNHTGKINLLYSEKFKKDLYPLSSFKNLKPLITLTRENKYFPYKKGRVTSQLNSISIGDSQLYFLCGNTRMILEVKNILRSKGVSDGSIIFESFYY